MLTLTLVYATRGGGERRSTTSAATCSARARRRGTAGTVPALHHVAPATHCIATAVPRHPLLLMHTPTLVMSKAEVRDMHGGHTHIHTVGARGHTYTGRTQRIDTHGHTQVKQYADAPYARTPRASTHARTRLREWFGGRVHSVPRSAARR